LGKFFASPCFRALNGNLQIWEISQAWWMYLAALPPLFSLVSTYFIDILDGVGGGGSPKTNTQNKNKKQSKRKQKKPQRRTLRPCGAEALEPR
jgi:hypothetical protein